MKNNKLIAEFMGHKLGLDGDGMGEPQCRIFEKGLGTKRIEDTYSKSWDWLMPVVNKIRVPYNNTEVTGERCEDIISVLAEGCIEANIIQVYEAVVEFIEDYNDGSTRTS